MNDQHEHMIKHSQDAAILFNSSHMAFPEGSLNLNEYPNAKRILIKGCQSLQHVVAHGHKQLRELVIKDCPNLEDLTLAHCNHASAVDVNTCNRLVKVDTRECSVLQQLLLHACDGLTTLVTTRCTGLLQFHIGSCGAMQQFTLQGPMQLDSFSMEGCRNLKELNVSGACTVQRLHLQNCSKLAEFKNLKLLNGLVELNVSLCVLLRQLIIDGFQDLEIILAEGCRSLKALDLSTCRSLKTLKVQGCIKLGSLQLANCMTLLQLNVNSCSLRSLELQRYLSLEELRAEGCRCLKTLDVSDCIALKELSVQGCMDLVTVRATNCISLSFLNICFCLSLQEIDGRGSKAIEKLMQAGCSKLPKYALKGFNASAQEQMNTGNALLSSMPTPPEKTTPNLVKWVLPVTHPPHPATVGKDAQSVPAIANCREPAPETLSPKEQTPLSKQTTPPAAEAAKVGVAVGSNHTKLPCSPGPNPAPRPSRQPSASFLGGGPTQAQAPFTPSTPPQSSLPSSGLPREQQQPQQSTSAPETSLTPPVTFKISARNITSMNHSITVPDDERHNKVLILKISRQGDSYVRMVYVKWSDRARFCDVVKVVKARFGFSRSSDFDLYLIDDTEHLIIETVDDWIRLSAPFWDRLQEGREQVIVGSRATIFESENTPNQVENLPKLTASPSMPGHAVAMRLYVRSRVDLAISSNNGAAGELLPAILPPIRGGGTAAGYDSGENVVTTPPTYDTLGTSLGLSNTLRSFRKSESFLFTFPEGKLVQWSRMVLLGRGSFGSVYEGITSDGRIMAVKVQDLSPDEYNEDVKALEQEINLMKRLDHKNVVAYYGCQTRETQGGGRQMEIFMELCHGGALSSLRKKFEKANEKLSIGLVRTYTAQILEGLAYLHESNVVHRDIKSDNVLISSQGEAKLADFGCSKRLGTSYMKSGGSQQSTGDRGDGALYPTMVGTSMFMAPEVVDGSGLGYSMPADIWSTGCLVIELLGRVPWADSAKLNPYALMYRIANSKEMPTGVPKKCQKELLDFFKNCFERDVSKRATAEQLLQHPWITMDESLLEEVPPDPKLFNT